LVPARLRAVERYCDWDRHTQFLRGYRDRS
jgi:hypothetical protein